MLQSCEEGSTSKVPPQEIGLMKGLLVGIRVLNKAPMSWGAMERVPLDSHDRARKLTWNPQHGELSLWRPLSKMLFVFVSR